MNLKKLFLFGLMFLSAMSMKSQTKPDELYKWMPSLVTGIGISQVELENWAQGGENTFAYSFLVTFDLKYQTDLWKFKNYLKVNYGQTKLGESTFRTTENEIYLEDVISYNAGFVLDPFASNIVRTSITRGFDYKSNPKTLIANFFDPGYITQSIGFAYDKLPNIQTRLGIAFQETFTTANALARRYSDDPKTTNDLEKFKFETGMESVTDGKFSIDENVTLTSKLRLFTRFEDLSVWDVRWDNIIVAKVNSWLNVNLGVIILHEISQSYKTQLKEAIQIGITYRLL